MITIVLIDFYRRTVDEWYDYPIIGRSEDHEFYRVHEADLITITSALQNVSMISNEFASEELRRRLRNEVRPMFADENALIYFCDEFGFDYGSLVESG